MWRNPRFLSASGFKLTRSYSASWKLQQLFARRAISSSPKCPEKKKIERSYLQCPGSHHFLGLTIGQLVDHAADHWGQEEAVVDMSQGIRRTFTEVKDEANNMGAGLLDLGLNPGDRIGIWGPNSYQWYLTMFAAAKAGLILVTLNPAYQAPEIQYCLNKVGVKAVICPEKFKTQNYYDILMEAAAMDQLGKSSKVPSLEHIVVISKETRPRAIAFHDLMETGDTNSVKKLLKLQDSIQMDEPCNIQFTSGTTGKPKAAALSHHNIVNNSYFVGRRLGYNIKQERLCVPIPMFHCYSNVGAVLNGMHHGASCIFPSPGFKPKDVLHAIANEKCTVVYGTPTMYVDMLNSSDLDSCDLSSLHIAISSGSVCPEGLMKDIKRKLKVDSVLSFYGMTETSPVNFQTSPHDSEEMQTTSVGLPGEHVEAKVVDKNGKIVPIGHPGELCIRGYLTMLGYWEDPEKTEEILSADGWLRTGDLFVMDENGYGHIVGRLKDMIIRGGENIYPKEIEEFLQTHPKILEAQVFGLPDDRLGEEICSWIRPKEGQNLTAGEIKTFCKGKLAHYKIPQYVHFTDNFPKTASGKIQKFKLQQDSLKIFGLQK